MTDEEDDYDYGLEAIEEAERMAAEEMEIDSMPPSMRPEFWWQWKEEYIWRAALKRFNEVVLTNKHVFENMKEQAKLYHGKMPVLFDETGPQQEEDKPATHSETGAVARINAVRTAVDAWVAIVGRQRPMPKVVSSGVNWETQNLTVNLNDFLNGGLKVSSLYQNAPDALRDCAACGLGAWRWNEDEDENRVVTRRLVPWQVVVDQMLVTDGRPPYEVFVWTLENVAQVCAEYKSKRAAISSSTRLGDNKMQIIVYEAWYLGKDGPIYLKFTDRCLLEKKGWKKKPRLPITFIHYAKKISGFYGIGLGEMLEGSQMRIEEIQAFITEMHRRYLRPTIFTNSASGQMSVSSIEGLKASIVHVPASSSPHRMEVPDAVHPQIYAEVDRILDNTMREHGISNFATNSQVPVGIESGPALREVSFKNMERHNQAATRYEEAFVEAGHQLIEGYQRMKAKKKKIVIPFDSKTGVDFIEWPELDLNKMAYSITLEAAALDSLSPWARLQKVMELAQMGVLNGPEELRKLIRNPDLEASDMFSSASFIEDALWTISQLHKQIKIAPDPAQRFSVLIPMVQAAYLRAKRLGAPDGVTRNLNSFLSAAIELQKKSAMQGLPQGQLPDDGMPASNVARAAAQGLSGPGAQGGTSREGI